VVSARVALVPVDSVPVVGSAPVVALARGYPPVVPVWRAPVEWAPAESAPGSRLVPVPGRVWAAG
jgi:hypothetical protein